MQRIVNYATSQTAIATYAAITASPSTLITPRNQFTVPSFFVSGTLLAFANAGTTAGAVQPFAFLPDGNSYPLAAPTTVTAQGFGFFFQVTSPVMGLSIQITTTIVGGSVNLFCIGILV